MPKLTKPIVVLIVLLMIGVGMASWASALSVREALTNTGGSGGTRNAQGEGAAMPKKECPMPSNLGQGITGGAKEPCAAGGTLATGKSCFVECAAGYEGAGGTTEYSCDNGSLKKASLKCESSKCIVPKSLGTGVQGGGAGQACVPDSTLGQDEDCSVKCAPGYVSSGGSSQYKCGKDGQLLPATLRCVPATCNLPADFGKGRTWGGADPCEEGGHLRGGGSCTIKCAQGYKEEGGSPIYKCGTDGKLDKASLQCVPNRCTLPNSFGGRMVEGGTKPCQAGKDMDAGDFCTVACAKGFKSVSGSPDFTCSPDGELTPPSLECEPISCSLPASFGPGVVGRGEDACVPGAVLRAGKKCRVGCGPGQETVGAVYGPEGNTDTAEYQCSDAGFLTEPALACKKSVVRAYDSVWALNFGGMGTL